MRQFYKNTLYATLVFLLMVLMQYLRLEAVSVNSLLSLGMLYGTGIAGAALGSSLIADAK
ncbi:hypothetical protein [Pontibacter roseus]|uniref:hypothetical protein n=1 Tax=Pontibacter roseus TaxID=336989 RepID=UPI0003A5B8CF|nr:hypothetical protein [Pontibacter roseus]